MMNLFDCVEYKNRETLNSLETIQNETRKEIEKETYKLKRILVLVKAGLWFVEDP